MDPLPNKTGMPPRLRELYNKRIEGRISQRHFELSLAKLVARDLRGWKVRPLPSEPQTDQFIQWRQWKQQIRAGKIHPKRSEIEEADGRIARNYSTYFDSHASISNENQATADFLAWLAQILEGKEIGDSRAISERLQTFRLAGYQPNATAFRGGSDEVDPSVSSAPSAPAPSPAEPTTDGGD
jgi:hypothetical protein